MEEEAVPPRELVLLKLRPQPSVPRRRDDAGQELVEQYVGRGDGEQVLLLSASA
jgi:hypothetical protein